MWMVNKGRNQHMRLTDIGVKESDSLKSGFQPIINSLSPVAFTLWASIFSTVNSNNDNNSWHSSFQSHVRQDLGNLPTFFSLKPLSEFWRVSIIIIIIIIPILEMKKDFEFKELAQENC